MAFIVHIFFLVLTGTSMADQGVGGLSTVREQTGFKRLFGFKKKAPKFKYIVKVTTGRQGTAGTDANVYITIFGSQNNPSERELKGGIFENDFERGKTDKFKLKFEADLGVIKKIRIRKDNFGILSDWNLERVKIKAPDGTKYIFNCDCLLSKKTTLSRELYPVTSTAILGGCGGIFAKAAHCWPFNEVQSNRSPDLKGGFPAMLKDGARLADSVARGRVACTLERGSWIDMGNLQGKCISDPDLCVNGITMMFWGRIEQSHILKNPSVPKEIISSGGIDSRSKGFSFFYKQNFWELRVANGPKIWTTIISQDQIPLDKWFSFAFTWNKATGKINYFVNGKAGLSNNQVYDARFPHIDMFNDLTISKPNSNNRIEQMLPMKFDQFVTWGRVLQLREIQRAFIEGGGVPPTEGATANHQACNPNPCKNGGTCKIDVDEPSSYRCECPWQYTGLICEVREEVPMTTSTSGAASTTAATTTTATIGRKVQPTTQTTTSSASTGAPSTITSPTAKSTTAPSPTTAPGTKGLPTSPTVTTAKATTASVSTGVPGTGTGPTATARSTAGSKPTSAPASSGLPTTAGVTTAKSTIRKVSTGVVGTGTATTETARSVATTKLTTAPSAAGRPTTAGVTTAKSTTRKISTGAVTTGTGTTATARSTAGSKPTTAPASSGRPTTAVVTTAKSTTRKVSTEVVTTGTARSVVTTKPTTTPSAAGRPTTAGVTTAKSATRKVSTEVVTTGTARSVVTTKPTTTPSAAGRPTSVTTAKSTTRKVSTGVVGTGTATTETARSVATTKPTSAPSATGRPTTAGVTTAKSTTRKVSTGVVGTGTATTETARSVATTKPTSAPSATGHPTTAGVTTAKSTTRKVSTGVVGTGTATTETARSVATTKPTSAPSATGRPTTAGVTTAKSTTRKVSTAVVTTGTATTETARSVATTKPTSAPSATGRPTTAGVTTAKSTTRKVSTAVVGTGTATTETARSVATTKPTSAPSATGRPTTAGVTTAKSTTRKVSTAVVTTGTATTETARSVATTRPTSAPTATGRPTVSTGGPSTGATTTAAASSVAPTTKLPTTAGPAPDLKQVTIELTLEINLFRRLHGCPDVTITDKLSQEAEQWAKAIAADGIEKIDPKSTYGQLVCSHSSGSNIAKACAVKWYGANKFYDWAEPKLTPKASPFTQMVWKSNSEAGVGIAKGGGGYKRQNVGGKYYVVVLFNPGQDANANIKENVLPATGISEPAPQATCPEGYSKVPQGSRSCFSLKTTPLSWDDALYGCALDNGTLASLQSKEESDLVLNLMTASSIREAWIGLHDRSKEGRYVWIDGSTIPFSEWLQGEPNGGTSENCIAHTKGNYGGGWADKNCLETKAFVCEVPVPGYTTYKLTFNLTEPNSQYYQNNLYPQSLYPGVYTTCTPYVQSGNDLLRETITRYFQAKNIAVLPLVNTIGCMPNGLSIVEVILKLGPEAGSDSISSLQTSIRQNDGELELSNGASAKLISVTILNPGVSYCPSQCAATWCQPGCDSYCCTQSTGVQYPLAAAVQQQGPVYTNTYPPQQCPAACTSNTNYCPPYCSASCCKRRVNIHRF